MDTITAQHHPLARTWGRNLRAQRTLVGKTQRDLAAVAGVTQATISRWENGELIVPPQLASELARAVLASPDVLFPWTVNA